MKKIIVFFVLIASAQTFLLADNVDFVANKVCLGTYTTLVGTSSFPDSLIASYRWDLNNDNIYNDAIGKNISYLFNAANNFPVRVKIVMKDAVEHLMSLPKLVEVYPVPNANFTVENVCQGQVAIFSSTSTISNGTINQFLWDFNNDGIFDNTSGPQVSFNYNNAGNYTTLLEIVSDKDCHALVTKSTQVFAKPVANFSFQNACTGSPVIFTNQTNIANDNLLYCFWHFGDNTTANTTGNVNHQYDFPGTYNTRLIAVSNHFCSDTINQNVNVFSAPTINMQVLGDTMFYPGQQTSIQVMGNFLNAEWMNGYTGNTLQINQPGLYTVEVTDANGCKSKDSVQIYSKLLNAQLVKSDIITPNGDGINDYLFVDNLHFFSVCKIKIFNMWGDKIFEDAVYNNQWRGEGLETGAYYYVITTDKFEAIGCINLLR
ncbi:MAG: hypothetical protein A2275_02710 [Bacteroidetes bacterium RIFOXYA12_FULL_35_11]|nr:MAG: hypothetical protein A2X01_07120 [Bacteroidetes bacterium GWF2_35_48]OFY82112.1 MAG: hypothetical protein A2275_02710 [Bacteroidetes bacterium RIFOXYA12_FULL_35_11]OFY93240.1 MAG: hypothetical protein A2309_09120 [Bacteroidetes bacterium RIFOXYB2_FULL_35_7]OFZ03586.1 MAG: hypothetical protein A2491_05170 [Bacteroidetes bacterium RIFOXYC12_FULL_35_7]HBX53157.1 hypothetical protein [Bacteroidales bacterium]